MLEAGGARDARHVRARRWATPLRDGDERLLLCEPRQTDHESYFCAELVAAILREGGLLDRKRHRLVVPQSASVLFMGRHLDGLLRSAHRPQVMQQQQQQTQTLMASARVRAAGERAGDGTWLARAPARTRRSAQAHRAAVPADSRACYSRRRCLGEQQQASAASQLQRTAVDAPDVAALNCREIAAVTCANLAAERRGRRRRRPAHCSGSGHAHALTTMRAVASSRRRRR